MSRIKRFTGRVDVSNEFLEQDPAMARALAAEAIRDQLAGPLKGPRGGAYVVIGEMGPIQEHPNDEDFTRPVTQTVFWAKQFAKYVRPNR